MSQDVLERTAGPVPACGRMRCAKTLVTALVVLAAVPSAVGHSQGDLQATVVEPDGIHPAALSADTGQRFTFTVANAVDNEASYRVVLCPADEASAEGCPSPRLDTGLLQPGRSSGASLMFEQPGEFLLVIAEPANTSLAGGRLVVEAEATAPGPGAMLGVGGVTAVVLAVRRSLARPKD